MRETKLNNFAAYHFAYCLSENKLFFKCIVIPASSYLLNKKITFNEWFQITEYEMAAYPILTIIIIKKLQRTPN